MGIILSNLQLEIPTAKKTVFVFLLVSCKHAICPQEHKKNWKNKDGYFHTKRRCLNDLILLQIAKLTENV